MTAALFEITIFANKNDVADVIAWWNANGVPIGEGEEWDRNDNGIEFGRSWTWYGPNSHLVLLELFAAVPGFKKCVAAPHRNKRMGIKSMTGPVNKKFDKAEYKNPNSNTRTKCRVYPCSANDLAADIEDDTKVKVKVKKKNK